MKLIAKRTSFGGTPSIYIQHKLNDSEGYISGYLVNPPIHVGNAADARALADSLLIEAGRLELQLAEEAKREARRQEVERVLAEQDRLEAERKKNDAERKRVAEQYYQNLFAPRDTKFYNLKTLDEPDYGYTT